MRFEQVSFHFVHYCGLCMGWCPAFQCPAPILVIRQHLCQGFRRRWPPSYLQWLFVVRAIVVVKFDDRRRRSNRQRYKIKFSTFQNILGGLIAIKITPTLDKQLLKCFYVYRIFSTVYNFAIYFNFHLYILRYLLLIMWEEALLFVTSTFQNITPTADKQLLKCFYNECF